jgi:ribonuclease HI
VKPVTITTDGSCIGNPGPGGWACILRFNGFAREMFGSESNTTNNRMELKAVVEALNALNRPCEVAVNTDSQYVRLGITEWLEGWKARGWRTSGRGGSGGKPVLNRDLWVELDKAAGRHQVVWNWVKGHAAHADNIRCDCLAQKAAREQIASCGEVVKEVSA